MAVAPKIQYLSPQEYLERERASEVRHEYLKGEMVAMAGSSRRHSLIKHHLERELGLALDKQGCDVVSSDQRVWIEARRRYFYPDIIVLCEGANLSDNASDTITNPTVLIEILSVSTEKFDRGEKWLSYQTLPSLKAYVLVSQETPCVEWYERTDTGWNYHLAEGMEAEFKLTCLKISISLSSIYAKINFLAIHEA